MIATISNEYLTVDISTKGAELQHILSTADHVNYMWNGDANFWAKFSPVLFPIVGALKNNTYSYKGIEYTLPRHGFARDLDFECLIINSTAVDFKLKYSADTLKIYPFKFELTIKYRLEGASLACTYQVFNAGESEMLFSIGAHPAFAAPLNNEGAYQDYYLQFSDDDELTYHHIVDNLVSNETSTLQLKDRKLPLKHALFYDDALVFKTLKSNHISLLNTRNANGLDFHFEGFPYFGIWAAKDADFVCLEPWCGIADGVGHNGQFGQKEGVVRIDGGEVWERRWTISIF